MPVGRIFTSVGCPYSEGIARKARNVKTVPGFFLPGMLVLGKDEHMATWLDSIAVPTLLLDETRARRNIERMTTAARSGGVHFRPHFKTHQAAGVGAWFQQAGVRAITVSSVAMARYFADHGWDDITVAFPVNLREIAAINRLAREIRLHLLVEHVAAAAFLASRLEAPVAIWIEVDAGYGRSGVPWNDGSGLTALATAVTNCPLMSLQGVLTHDGGTYAARTHEAITADYVQTTTRLERARNWLIEQGFLGLAISVGDTPACSVVTDFAPADEIRPGNFVFYDWTQVQIGSCTWDDVAVAVACPVVSLHPERNEIILYGGAVHLSKESLPRADGMPTFGAVVLLDEGGWGAPLDGAWLRSISQEHGVVRCTPDAYARLSERVGVGDLLGVLPIHSCLTADLLKIYQTTGGERIPMAPIPAFWGMAVP